MEWLIGFAIGVVSGIIASQIVLVADRRRTEKRLRAVFELLEGEYQHVNLQQQPISLGDGLAVSHVEYVGNATLTVKTSTRYGSWSARIKMDPILPEHGSGAFAYDDPSKGSGTIQLLVVEQSKRILVHALALNFVAAPPAAYWWVKVQSGANPSSPGMEQTA